MLSTSRKREEVLRKTGSQSSRGRDSLPPVALSAALSEEKRISALAQLRALRSVVERWQYVSGKSQACFIALLLDVLDVWIPTDEDAPLPAQKIGDAIADLPADTVTKLWRHRRRVDADLRDILQQIQRTVVRGDVAVVDHTTLFQRGQAGKQRHSVVSPIVLPPIHRAAPSRESRSAVRGAGFGAFLSYQY
jgi:hypothetical protein